MILYGAGRHARVVIDCLLDARVEIGGFFDDNLDLVSLNGFDVLGKYDPTLNPQNKLVITICDNKVRQTLSNLIEHPFGVIKHPSTVVSKYARIEKGTTLLHGVIVQTGTKIGKHCIVNTGASIDHDCVIGDYCHISPRVTLCDSVVLNEGVQIGAGAIILPHVTIGKWCVIGAGSVITEDLPDYSEVIATPNKLLKKV